MPEPTEHTKQQIKRMAILRVEGNSWAQIAALPDITRNTDITARAVTQEYPDEWRQAYEEPRFLFLDEIEAEAALTQRQLLRSADDRVKQSAAHSILHHCRSLRAQKVELSGSVSIPTWKDLVEGVGNGNA